MTVRTAFAIRSERALALARAVGPTPASSELALPSIAVKARRARERRARLLELYTAAARHAAALLPALDAEAQADRYAETTAPLTPGSLIAVKTVAGISPARLPADVAGVLCRILVDRGIVPAAPLLQADGTALVVLEAWTPCGPIWEPILGMVHELTGFSGYGLPVRLGHGSIRSGRDYVLAFDDSDVEAADGRF